MSDLEYRAIMFDEWLRAFKKIEFYLDPDKGTGKPDAVAALVTARMAIRNMVEATTKE